MTEDQTQGGGISAPFFIPQGTSEAKQAQVALTPQKDTVTAGAGKVAQLSGSLDVASIYAQSVAAAEQELPPLPSVGPEQAQPINTEPYEQNSWFGNAWRGAAKEGLRIGKGLAITDETAQIQYLVNKHNITPEEQALFARKQAGKELSPEEATALAGREEVLTRLFKEKQDIKDSTEWWDKDTGYDSTATDMQLERIKRDAEMFSAAWDNDDYRGMLESGTQILDALASKDSLENAIRFSPHYLAGIPLLRPFFLASDVSNRTQTAQELFRDTYGSEMDQNELNKAAALSALSSGIEHFGEMIALKGVGKAVDDLPGVNPAARAAKKELTKAERIARAERKAKAKTGEVKYSAKDRAADLKQALTGGTARTVGAPVIVGAVGEGVTEATGAYIDQYAGLQDADKLNATDAVVEGLVAAGAGGATSGVSSVGRGVQNVKKNYQESMEVLAKATETEARPEVTTEDALNADSHKEFLDSDPTDTAHLDELDARTQALKEEGKRIQAGRSVRDLPEEEQEQVLSIAKQLTELQAHKANLTEATPEDIQAVEQSIDPEQAIKARKEELKVHASQLLDQKNNGEITADAYAAQMRDIVKQVEALNKGELPVQDEAQVRASAEKVLTSMFSRPDQFTREQVQRFANSPALKGKKPIMDKWNSWFNTTRKVQRDWQRATGKSISEVNQDILKNGFNGFESVQDYIGNIGTAIATGNADLAQKQMWRMYNLLDNQNKKLNRPDNTDTFTNTVTAERDAIEKAWTTLGERVIKEFPQLEGQLSVKPENSVAEVEKMLNGKADAHTAKADKVQKKAKKQNGNRPSNALNPVWTDKTTPITKQRLAAVVADTALDSQDQFYVDLIDSKTDGLSVQDLAQSRVHQKFLKQQSKLESSKRDKDGIKEAKRQLMALHDALSAYLDAQGTSYKELLGNGGQAELYEKIMEKDAKIDEHNMNDVGSLEEQATVEKHTPVNAENMPDSWQERNEQSAQMLSLLDAHPEKTEEQQARIEEARKDIDSMYGAKDRWILLADLINDLQVINGEGRFVEADAKPVFARKNYNNSAVIAKQAHGLVGEHMQGTANKDTDFSLFRRVENLVTTLQTESDEVIDGMTRHMTDEQRELLHSKLVPFMEAMADKMRERMWVGEARSKNGEISQYDKTVNNRLADFIMGGTDGDPIINENLLSQMALEAYDWLADKGRDTLKNDREDVAKIFHGSGDNTNLVTPEQMEAGLYAGIPMNVLSEALGTKALRHLGLVPKGTAPDFLTPQLRQNIGLTIIDAMIESDLVELNIVEYVTRDKNGKVEKRQLSRNDEGAVPVLRTRKQTLNGKELEETRFIAKASGKGEQYVQGERFIRVKSADTPITLSNGETLVKPEPATKAAKLIEGYDMDLMEKLNGSNAKDREYFTEETFDQMKPHDKTKNGENLSSLQKKVMDASSKIKWFLDSKMDAVLYDLLDDNHRLAIMGLQSDEEIDATVAKQRRDTVRATRDDMLNKMGHYHNERELIKGKPIFFRWNIVKNRRMMMESKKLNPQGNKYARHLIKPENHYTTVDTHNFDSMQGFINGVTASLGFSVDKTEWGNIRDYFHHDLLARKSDKSKTIMAGVDALRAMRKEGKNEAHQQAVVDAVKAGGEKAWSLDGLVALADYMDALENGDTSFQSSLMHEVDGITNGVSIGLYQFAGTSNYQMAKEMLERTGIGLDEPQKSYGKYISNKEKNRDSYQQLIVDMLAWFDKNKTESKTEQTGMAYKSFGKMIPHSTAWAQKLALEFIMAEKDALRGGDNLVTKAGRDLAKDPLMTSNYGRAIANIIESMGFGFRDKILERIEGMVKKYEGQELQDQLTELENQVRLVIPGFNGEPTFTINREAPLETYIGDFATAQLVESVKNTFGKAMDHSIRTNYGVYQEQAGSINDAVGMAWNMYKHLLDESLKALRTTRRTELGEEYDYNTEADLAEAIDKLKPYAPTVFTAISDKVAKGELFEDGIDFAYKKDKKKDHEGTLDPSKLTDEQKRSMVTMQFKRKKAQRGSYSMSNQYSTSTYSRSPEHPGVSPAVLLIQHLDASTMVRLMEQFEGLNVHDAYGFAANEAIQGTRAMNKVFHETMMDYDIHSHVLDTLKRVAEGYAKLTGDTKLENIAVKYSPKTGEKTVVALKEHDREISASEFIRLYRERVRVTKHNRSILKDRIKSVVQYNMENGVYLVPETGEQVSAEQAGELIAQATDQAQQAKEWQHYDNVAYRSVFRKKDLAKLKPSKHVDPWSDKKPAEQENSVDEEPTPTVEPDAVEDKYHAALAKGATPQQLLDMLAQDENLTPFHHKVAEQLKKQLDSDVAIRYLNDPNYKPLRTDRTAKNILAGKYPGYWKQTGKNRRTVYLAGPALPNPAHAEVILHELDHAVSGRKIQDMRDGRTEKSNEYRYLERLLERARATLVDTAPAEHKEYIQSQLDYIGNDISEFVTYARTDRTFMDAMKHTRIGAAERKTLWTEFVRALASLMNYLPDPKLDSNLYLETLNAADAFYSGESLAPVPPTDPDGGPAPDTVNSPEYKLLEAYNPRSMSAEIDQQRMLWAMQDGLSYADARALVTEKQGNKLSNAFKAWERKHGLNKVRGATDYHHDADTFTRTLGDITADNTQQIFEQVENLSSIKPSEEHKKHLSSVLDSVRSVMNPVKIRFKQWTGENDGFIKSGEGIFIAGNKGARNNNIEMSPQEVLVHELVHAVLDNANKIATNSVASYKLNKLFKQAKAQLKPEDFLANPQDALNPVEMAAAKARYDHIFNHKGATKDGHLHEFAALGTTNAQVRKALSKLDGVKNTRSNFFDNKFLQKLENIVFDAIEAVSKKITGMPDGKMDEQLLALMQDLAGVENNHKSGIYTKILNGADSVAGSIYKLTEKVTSPLNDFVSGRFDGTYTDAMRRTLHGMGVTKNVTAMKLFTEIGLSKSVRPIMDMLLKKKQMSDSQRAETVQHHIQMLTKAFGEDFPQEDYQALTRSMLYTDLEVVIQQFGMAGTLDLVKDPAKLDAEIKKLRHDLSKNFGKAQSTYFKAMAANLGHEMATGVSYLPVSVSNAMQIARMSGSGLKVDWNADAAEQTIDLLASLHAIKSTAKADKDSLVRVAKTKLNEDTENDTDSPLWTVVNMHRTYKQLSLEENFGGNRMQMEKGYVRETTNPNVEVTTAYVDQAEEMKKLGFEMHSEVNYDPNHPTLGKGKKIAYFVNPFGGKATYHAGAISTTGKGARGTDNLGVLDQLNPNIQNGAIAHLQTAKMIKGTRDHIAEIMQTGGTKVDHAVAAPIFDELGNITGYRYKMSHKNKREVLERNDDIRQVIGATQASILDKKETKNLNAKTLEVLGSIYDEAERKDEFRFVHEKATDPKLIEYWRLLPSDTQQMAMQMFPEGIPLKIGHEDVVFGYRAMSVAQIKEGQRIFGVEINKAMVALLNNQVTRTTESALMELTKLFKDSVVIKNITTTLANQMSNTVFLKLLGVPLKDIVKDQVVAMRGVTEYQRDIYERFEIESKLKGTSLTSQEREQLEQDLNNINRQIAANPVAELIEAGVFQSIVDDVEVGDMFSYDSWLDAKTKKLLSPVPEGIKDIGKNLMLTHDTKAYKVLSQMGQISDFTARYTLHKHNMAKGMSKEQSIREIVDMFVNYDIPTNRTLQYLNDTGFVMFTKYYMRMQKVLMKVAGERPAQAIMTLIGAEMFDLSNPGDAAITPSSLMNRLHSPLDSVSGMFDTASINVAQSVIL